MSFISTHTRFESPGSASTVSDLIKQAVKLGRTHIFYTDTSRLTSVYKAYKEAQEQKIKFIAGCEVQIDLERFKLPFKYATITVYPKNQNAFQALSNFLSHPKGVRLTKGDAEIPYFDFLKLIDLLKNNSFACNFHGIHSLLSKMLMTNSSQTTEMINEIKSVCKDVSISVIAAKEDRSILDKVYISFDGKTSVSLNLKDLVEIDVFIDGKFKRIKIHASELLEDSKKTIASISPNGIKYNLKPTIPAKVWLKREEIFHSHGCLNKFANSSLVEFANLHNLPIFVSDNAYMAKPESKKVQDAKLYGERLEVEDLYLLDEQSAVHRLLAQEFKKTDIVKWISDTQKWAESFDFSMKYEWRLPKIVENTQDFIDNQINKIGRMKWDDPKWVERLNYEMSIIRDNGVFDFSPYFVPIASVFEEYRKNGLITGPGRGSLSSSLLAYVMGFTHINPFDYDLDFNRFFSMDRVKTRKIPDADCDLQSRDLLVGTDGSGGLLKRMMGDKYAQISTRGNLRLKSSIQSVARSFNDGVVPADILKISNNLPTPPQGTSDKDYVFGYTDSEGNHKPGLIDVDQSLQEYAQKYPEQWAVVSEMLGISNSIGRHASAFVLCDVPVYDIVPTMTVRGHGPVTQYEAKEVEAAGLIKYDFLVVNALKDIQGCIDLINKKDKYLDDAGFFLHNGKRTFIWDLPQNDEGVTNLVKSGEFSSTFQVSTATATPLVNQIQPKNIKDFAVILALGRPGPLDFIDENTGRNMAEEYIWRRKGRSEAKIEGLKKALPDTFGSIVYQEDLTSIAKSIGKMSGERAEILRDHMCKKREKKMLEMKPEFMAGAVESVGEADAEEIWSQMKTFANYGFAKPHAVAYGAITYATFFLKAHYPLEWWSSVLKNADSKEIKEKFWKHVKYLVTPPDINLSNEEMLIDYESKTIRNKLSVIKGLSEAGVQKLVAGRPYRDLQALVDSENVGESMLKKMMHVGVLDSLLSVKNANLVQKMAILETAIANKKYKQKLLEFADKEKEFAEGKRKTRPKPPIQPEPALPDLAYLKMTAYEDIAIRKTLMPSVEVDITSAIVKSNKSITRKNGEYYILNPKGKTNVLKNGEEMRELDSENFLMRQEYLYYACGGIVIDMKEFLFNKNESRALKMLVDTDGYEREVVIWPDYNTKVLSYPENLKKGSVITLFYSRRSDRNRSYLNDIQVEFSPEEVAKEKKRSKIKA